MTVDKKKHARETWRDYTKRIARAEGLEAEILEAYDDNRRAGYSESLSAYHALYEWDC